jgi:hypothetical protein
VDAILKDEVRAARKHYNCDASALWCNYSMKLDDCETGDQRLIVEAAQADKWKILPGQQYRYMRGIFEGRMVTWRERVGMGSVCRQLRLYED